MKAIATGVAPALPIVMSPSGDGSGVAESSVTERCSPLMPTTVRVNPATPPVYLMNSLQLRPAILLQLVQSELADHECVLKLSQLRLLVTVEPKR